MKVAKLALEDGTPVLLEGKLGKGRVFVSACGLGQNGLARFVQREIRRRVVPFARGTASYGFVLMPLVDATRHVYLGVVNSRHNAALADTIPLFIIQSFFIRNAGLINRLFEISCPSHEKTDGCSGNKITYSPGQLFNGPGSDFGSAVRTMPGSQPCKQ